MERFTERDIDLWCEWMRKEFQYGVGKYGHDGSLRLVEQGAMDAPVNSWSSQSDRYLFEALHSRVLLEELGELPSKAKLNVVRAFGKYASNHLALLTYSHSFLSGKDPMEMHEILRMMFSKHLIGFDAEPVASRFLNLEECLKDENRQMYIALQSMQDTNEMERFSRSLATGSYISQAGFIVVSNEFGWVEPGVASGVVPELWDEVD